MVFLNANIQVMVEVSNGFKIGTVKFIGETEFAPGEWIGVALDRPIGELMQSHTRLIITLLLLIINYMFYTCTCICTHVHVSHHVSSSHCQVSTMVHSKAYLISNARKSMESLSDETRSSMNLPLPLLHPPG